MKNTFTKIVIILCITIFYIFWSVYFLVSLPQKVNNINSKIITNFKNKIYPQLKITTHKIEKTFWWLSFNFENNKNWVDIKFFDSFFIKKAITKFNFYWNLCNGNDKICFLNIKKRNEKYIVYPLYKLDIWFIKTNSLEIVCRLNDNKCYIYNMDNWMSKPLILGNWGYNNMFYMFK